MKIGFSKSGIVVLFINVEDDNMFWNRGEQIVCHFKEIEIDVIKVSGIL